MASLEQIEQFVAQRHIAVAGISGNPQKFGNAIFKELQKQGYHLYPISKHLTEFEGVKCFPDISSLPPEVTAIVINTKPEKTLILAREAGQKGIRHLWLQQGSTSPEMKEMLEKEGLYPITRECILMFASPAHFIHKAHRFVNKVVGRYPKPDKPLTQGK